MSVHTIQITGYTQGCDVIVSWNKTPMFQGSVQKTKDMQVAPLVQWTDNIEAGIISLDIHCTSGSLHWVDILMNNIGPPAHIIDPNAVWPKHVPSSHWELTGDLWMFGNKFHTQPVNDDALMSKYGLTWHECWARCIVSKDTPRDEDRFLQPYDGKISNVYINNQIQHTNPDELSSGPWHYTVMENEILSFDLHLNL